jgi:transposase-like protein
MKKSAKFSPEVRERAVRMVLGNPPINQSSEK